MKKTDTDKVKKSLEEEVSLLYTSLSFLNYRTPCLYTREREVSIIAIKERIKKVNKELKSIK